MADSGAQDRHLPPSQRKLDKAREKGQVARSRDLSHFAAVAAAGAALAVLAPTVSSGLQRALAEALRFDAAALAGSAAMGERLAALAGVFLWVALPLGALMMAVAVASAVVAGGWVWTLQPLAPDFSRLNPLTGLPRLVSGRQLGDALKAALLALVLGAVGAFYLARRFDRFADALALPLPAALAHAGSVIGAGLALVALALAAFALVDVPLQKHLHRTRLKMSRQELKDEHRQLEGNVEVKSKVKALMRERASRRMLAAVPRADLVVMNPTHYAVALRYDEATMTAPRVVAKGADLLALRIRDAAQSAKVPVLQSPVLARALYAHAEIDREIPARLFGAVAQVLAWVYQLRAAMAGRAAMPAAVPEVDVPAELDPHHRPEAAR
ncbi:MAG: flagellar biosynthesis protein FlhB [Betaproteobacteria bacterium]